jgi:uncharacterized repeat protein (TIGR03803 family)
MVLYNFNGQNSTGDAPYAPLIFDREGSLYGTAVFGGYYDSGMVFELTPQTSGEWTETIVHSFEPSNWDGGNPYGGLIMNAAGNLYGTTSQGGRDNYGTVFKFTHKAGGGWSEQQLHVFNNNGRDGYTPYCTLRGSELIEPRDLIKAIYVADLEHVSSFWTDWEGFERLVTDANESQGNKLECLRSP